MLNQEYVDFYTYLCYWGACFFLGYDTELGLLHITNVVSSMLVDKT